MKEKIYSGILEMAHWCSEVSDAARSHLINPITPNPSPQKYWWKCKSTEFPNSIHCWFLSQKNFLVYGHLTLKIQLRAPIIWLDGCPIFLWSRSLSFKVPPQLSHIQMTPTKTGLFHPFFFFFTKNVWALFSQANTGGVLPPLIALHPGGPHWKGLFCLPKCPDTL